MRKKKCEIFINFFPVKYILNNYLETTKLCINAVCYLHRQFNKVILKTKTPEMGCGKL